MDVGGQARSRHGRRVLRQLRQRLQRLPVSVHSRQLYSSQGLALGGLLPSNYAFVGTYAVGQATDPMGGALSGSCVSGCSACQSQRHAMSKRPLYSSTCD